MFWRSKKCCFRRKKGVEMSQKTTDQKVISHSVSGITNGSIVPWIAHLKIKMMLRWLQKVNNLVVTKSNLGEFMSCGKFGSLFMRHNLKTKYCAWCITGSCLMFISCCSLDLRVLRLLCYHEPKMFFGARFIALFNVVFHY